MTRELFGNPSPRQHERHSIPPRRVAEATPLRWWAETFGIAALVYAGLVIWAAVGATPLW